MRAQRWKLPAWVEATSGEALPPLPFQEAVLFDRSFHLLWGPGKVSRNSQATEVQPLTSKAYMKEVLGSMKTAKSGLGARRSPRYLAKWKGYISQKAKLLFLVGRSFWMISTLWRATSAQLAGRESRLSDSHSQTIQDARAICHY